MHALHARAYTTAPQSWAVYLSQRKRWALGSKANEITMIFRPGINWLERVSAIIQLFVWWLGPFIAMQLVIFILAVVHNGGSMFSDPIMIGLLSVLAFRYVSG